MRRAHGGNATVQIRRRTLIASAAIATTVVSASVVLTPARSVADPSCPAYEFIGARGSGEAADQFNGMGDLLEGVYEKVAAALAAGQVVPYGVDYPAVGLTDSVAQWANAAGAVTHISVLGAYHDSVVAGTANIQAEIERIRASACFGTTFVILAGYSQGAQAAADALQNMPAKDLALVSAASFFGDPYFNPHSWAARGDFDPGHYGALGVRDEYLDYFKGKVFSYCHNNDPICNLSVKEHVLGTPIDVYVRDIPRLVEHGFAEHNDYADRGDDGRAAQNILDALGISEPVQPSTNTPIDLVAVIDTTGSMGDVIDAVKQNVDDMVATIASTTSDYRFALVDYKDWGQGDPYQSRLDVPFTTDTAALQAGVNALSASGGGDWEESVYSGVMTALSQPWRAGVKKVVVVIGDAPPKDPEPNTGYTGAYVVGAALAIDPGVIDTLSYGNDSTTDAMFKAMSDGTAGIAATPSNTAALVASLQQTLQDAGRAPTADAGGPYTATAGIPVSLSAANTRDPFGHITKYEWDLDGDGNFETVTDAPVLTTTFASTGSHVLTLRATSSTGLTALAQASVEVSSPPASAPASPVNLTAAAGDGQIKLTWNAGSGPAPDFYVIRDGSGSVIDTVMASAAGEPIGPWIDLEVTNGVASSYAVTAANAAGESPPVSITSTPSPTAIHHGPVISAGAGSAYVVTPSGGLADWGSGAKGQLGNGGTTSSSTPVNVSGVSALRGIAAGADFAIAVRTDGTVLTWGNNKNGQLGNGTTTSTSTPAVVPGLSSTSDVAAGTAFALAVDNGYVTSWGADADGQLGDNLNSGNRTSPTGVLYQDCRHVGTQLLCEYDALAGSQVAAGDAFGLALQNGRIYSWGSNKKGQLATGTTTSRSFALPIAVTDAAAIAAGGSHALALLSNGSVEAWGDGTGGDLGNGATTNATSPVSVVGLSGVTAVAAGTNHSLALKSDGSVWAWGYNSSGQLGTGTTTNATTPVRVGGLSNIVAIAAGGNSSYAVSATGSVYVWGENSSGQLGIGTSTNAVMPTLVAGVTALQPN